MPNSKIALESTLNFATMSQGLVSLADSAKFAGALVNKFGMDLSRVRIDETGQRITALDRAMDMLARTAQITGFQIRDFPIAFNSLRTAAREANMDLETTLTLMGALKTTGMSAAETRKPGFGLLP